MWSDIFKDYPGFRVRVRDVASVESVECGLFDHVLNKPGFRELIDELGLVLGPPPPVRDCLFFCERWQLEKENQKRFQKNLCRELAKRNQKYSRYVYATLVDSPSRSHQGKVFRYSSLRSLPGMSPEETR